MSKEEIQALFESQSYEEIAKSYSRKELEEMKAEVYGVDIRVIGKKSEVAYSIKRYFDDMKRTADLSKNLR